MKLLDKAATKLSNENVHMFVLPGGYLFSPSNKGMDEIQEQVLGIAKKRKVDLLVGVDVKPKTTKPKPDIVQKGQLGAFSIFAPKNGEMARWRQRSSTRDDQISDELCQQKRVVWEKPCTESLICGEIFNAGIRDGLVKCKPVLVIDQVHEARGLRITVTMSGLAEKGISSVCSVHADVHKAMKQCYVRPGGKAGCKSSRDIDLEIGKEPMIEIKIWNFDSTGKIV